MYPQEIIWEVRALNDILDVVSGYVSLKPRSGNHFGLCPFHSEKSPSFSVNTDRQMFYCFGCGAGGNVLSFIMRIENIDFIDALKILADRVHYNLPEQSTPSAKKRAAERETTAFLNKQAARYFYDHLNSESSDAKYVQRYLASRGVQPKLISRFGLGLSPDKWDGLVEYLKQTNPEDLVAAGLATRGKKDTSKYYDRFRSRLMFPIIDSRNRVVGFGGRILESTIENPDYKEAKYVNTPDTSLFHKSEQLYGLNIARKTRATEMIIVEGYMDVLAMHQAGFSNTVGVLGTALTDSHCRLLTRAGCKAVVLILDADEAGIKAALRAIPILVKSELKIKVLNVSETDTETKDPDEFIQKHGADALAKLLATAKSHIQFQVNLIKQKYDLSTTEGRVEFTQESAKILATLSSDIELDVYIKEIGQASDIAPSAIYAEVNKQRGAKETNAPRRLKPQGFTPQERGLKDARKGLLNLVLTNQTAAKALENSKFLEPTEMGDAIYEKLLALAFENAAKDTECAPADIINFFETIESQQTVTEVFTTPHQYPSIEKALNDMAIIIKRAWIKSQVIENSDLNTLKSLQILEKNMAKQYITMSDG